MRKNIFLFFIFLNLKIWGMAPAPELTEDFWNSPTFVRSFMGDYGFRTEIEPKINNAEKTIIKEVIAKAENQLDDAIEYLEQKIDTKSSAALDFALATLYYQRGRLSKSSESYRLAIKKFPSFLRAHKNLGFVKLNLGNYKDASINFSRSISLGEADGVTYVALGYSYYMLGQYISAENAYRMGVLLFPDSKDARNGLVNCLLETSRFSEALAMLDELLIKEPENFFCHRARVAALQGLGKEKEATVALETLSRIGNLGTEDIIRLGDLYHNLGLYNLSLLNYEKAIERTDKLSVSKYIRVASILIDRGSYEDCFRYLKKIENIFNTAFNNEEEKAVLLLKSQVLLATGKSDESKSILRSIVEKNPLEGKALILLADLAWKEKDYSTASLFFERSGKIENWEVESLIQHGRMLVELRDYEKAVKLLERAQLLRPQDRVERFLKSIRNLLITSSIQL